MITTHRIKLSHLTLLASSLLLPASSFAAGFALKEASSSLLGSAFSAATTSKDNISGMAYNPATLSMHDGVNVYGTVSALETDGGFKNVNSGAIGVIGAANTPKQSNKGGDAFIPALFYSTDITNDVTFGLGVSAPWGLSTTYDENYAGRFHGVHSELESKSINPALSYRYNDHWSFAAGVQLIELDAELTNSVTNGVVTSFAKVKGRGWGGGFSLGALYQPTQQTTVGFGMQSAVKVRLKGTTDVTGALAALSGRAVSDITLPEKLNLGISHEYDDHWTVSAEVQWTRWSRIKELKFVTTTAAGAENASITDELWDDVFFFGVGVNYKLDKNWEFRVGTAFDESPIPDSTRTPRLPGNDRWFATFGALYHLSPNTTLDFGYMHVFVKDGKINLPGTGNDAARGSLTATNEAKVDIVAVGASVKF